MFRRALWLASLLACATLAQAQNSRHFTFRYEFSVKSPDPGKPLRIWFPMAHSDEWQDVRVVSATGDLPLTKAREQKYGNWVYFASTNKADKPEYRFSVVYDVVRRERIGLTDAERAASEEKSSPGSTSGAMLREASLRDPKLAPYLNADKLVPTTGLPAEIAAKQVEGRSGDLQKTRALYDYVLATMRYDKTGTGWGRGDTLWACDSKRGNCTDFHSLFMSMARSQGIPARFEMGFSIPVGKTEGEITGYHCWSDFYLAGKGWIPVDISEAWKNKDKAEYFFGAHDDNRVAFSMGRDLVLNPPQAGDPRNYFVYPYVEDDAKQYENVSTHFSFVEVGQSGAKASGR
ncbi:MAG TPA: transglutaminase domain-containing protein [Terriglobales bacterium]|nr:transglutaminase domain-containing protein [Terriglobales bacterium]